MEIIKILKALGDETRFRIIQILHGGTYTVNEILFVIGGRQSNISHHLKILSDNNLVESKKEGMWIYYRISAFYRTHLAHVIEKIDKSWLPEEIENDRVKIDMILKKRQEQAEKYFAAIDEAGQKQLLSFLDTIFSSAEITDLIKEKYHTILDVGCGNGRNLPVLAPFCDKVIGVDSSAKMLRLAEHLAKKSLLSYELFNSDITSLPFADESIDAVFINMVLHHVPVPQVAVCEAARVLSRNGNIFLIDMAEHNDESLRDTHGDLWLGFSEDDLVSWINAAGLQVQMLMTKSYMQHKKIIIIKATKPE